MFQFRTLPLFFLGFVSTFTAAESASWLEEALAARFADLAGDYPQALRHASALAKHSRQSDAYAYALELARAANHLSTAEHLARAWLAQTPDDEEALLALLNVLFASNQIEALLPYAERLLGQKNDPQHAVQLSRMSAELSNREDKITLFQTLSKRFPKNPYLHYYLGLIAKEQGKVDVALDAFRAASALDASWRQLDIMRAEVLSSVGNLSAAQKIIEPLRARAPNDPELLSAHIDLLADHYQWGEAAVLAEKWLKLQEDNLDVLQLLAWLRAQNGEISAARAAYSRLLALEHIDLNTFYFHVARAAEQAGDLNEAMNLLQAIEKSSPFHLLAWQQKALIALKQGQEALAAQLFQSLRQDYPEQALEFYLLEWTQRKRFDLAHHDLLIEAEQRFPDEPILALWRAEELQRQADTQQVEQAYLQLLSLEPNHVEALHAYGNWLLVQERREEGAQLIRDAIKHHAHAPEIQDSYARLLSSEAKWQEALNWQRRAYATYRSGEIVAHYIELLVMNDEIPLAEEVFQHEIKAQPYDPDLKRVGKRFGWCQDGCKLESKRG